MRKKRPNETPSKCFLLSGVFLSQDCVKIERFSRTLLDRVVSLSGSLDTATPAGRMVFTVLGAVAELECSLIVERVRAGLRNARAKGKRLGRPKAVVDACRIATLRQQGLSWANIADTVKLGEGTVRRAAQKLAKNPSSYALPTITPA